MLNQKQKLFCQYYLAAEGAYFGNAVKSYLKVYGGKEKVSRDYAAAQSSSSRLLRDDEIMSYMNSLLESAGLTMPYVDSELLELIKQNRNLPVKLAAIKEYHHINRRASYSPLEDRMRRALDKFAEFLPDD